jgi:hypothetical protein
MISEDGTGGHERSRAGKNPLQLSLFEEGDADRP